MVPVVILYVLQHPFIQNSYWVLEGIFLSKIHTFWNNLQAVFFNYHILSSLYFEKVFFFPKSNLQLFFWLLKWQFKWFKIHFLSSLKVFCSWVLRFFPSISLIYKKSTHLLDWKGAVRRTKLFYYLCSYITSPQKRKNKHCGEVWGFENLI